MKKSIHCTVLTVGLIVLGGTRSLLAQNNTTLLNHPGKIVYVNSSASFVEAPSLTGALKISGKRESVDPGLLKNALAISSVLFEAPVVNPLKGFNILPNISHTDLPGIDIKFLNYPFYKDNKTGTVKLLESWDSDLEVAINNPYVLFNSHFNSNIYNIYLNMFSDISPYNRLEGYDPHFYYKTEMHRDANGFLVVKGIDGTDEARVIAKKGIPFIIPVTQEVFINFSIKLLKMYIQKTNKAIASTRSDIEYQQKRNRKSLVESLKKRLQENKKHLPILEEAIQGNQAELKKMSAAQRNAPAYVDVYGSLVHNQQYNALATPSDKNRKELVRVNPAYFDKTLPKGEPQLIVVDYYTSGDKNLVAQKMKTWYNQIEYKKLQGMIK